MENRPIDQKITDTLKENYMPYAMSVIVSRAIPEIDGFKPSHRKLLYTMYKMGLLSGNRTKSANVVGQTMKLNPHGDMAIYETLVRLSKANEALLVPLIDSKGNFGKIYSRDMAFAASRYTEVKLAKICSEVFKDIECDCVDFYDNYDGTMKEPALLPTTFPNILVSANTGIAVGMASSFCGFNITEVCNSTIEYIKDRSINLLNTLHAPDFTTGGEIIVDRDEIKKIYDTGRGTFKIRSKWKYYKEGNLIEVTEIPYTTTIEAILDKVSDLVKLGKLKEISDIRDETDLKGLRIAIDLKRGIDPDKLMIKLFKMTPLMDSFSCNFNLLINGMPKVLGVRGVLDEWIAWRLICIRRSLVFELGKKSEKLHLLQGLTRILVDIDRVIQIIKDTEDDAEVVPNLMVGFGLDNPQAEYVADIKLRHINREHILKRTKELENLTKDIEDIQGKLNSESKILDIIVGQLRDVIKAHSKERVSSIIYSDDVVEYKEEEHVEDYVVTLFLTRDGYFKKITPQSLRMSGEQKVKDGDTIVQEIQATNRSEILFFTDVQQVYKIKVSEFEDTKASVLGDYLASKLQMLKDEKVVFMAVADDYSGFLVICFKNGRIAKISMSSYETKANRKKLTSAFSGTSPVVGMFYLKEDADIILVSLARKAILINTAQIDIKSTRTTGGVIAMNAKANVSVVRAELAAAVTDFDVSRHRVRTLPATGVLIRN